MKKSNLFIVLVSSLFSLALSACGTSDNSVDNPTEPDTPDTETPSTPSDKEDPITPDDTFTLGADVSWITQFEAEGKKFYTNQAVNKDLMQILHDDYGMTAIRLRVFTNPTQKVPETADKEHKEGYAYSAEGYCAKEDVVIKAKRATSLGMDVMIDFHYSDYWADPAKQYKPVAWRTLDKTALIKAIGDHTTDVLQTLKDEGVTPKWVQIGNEIRPGLLWDKDSSLSGATWDEKDRFAMNWKNLADYINAGYDAVKSIFPSAICLVHLDNGYDREMYTWWFDEAKKNGARWDMIGMSLYPYWCLNEKGTKYKTADMVINDCIANINAVSTRYATDVMIVETGVQVGNGKGGLATESQLSEQARQLYKIISDSRSKTGGHCRGVFYWEPECPPESYQLGAFDFNGRPTIIMNAFLK